MRIAEKCLVVMASPLLPSYCHLRSQKSVIFSRRKTNGLIAIVAALTLLLLPVVGQKQVECIDFNHHDLEETLVLSPIVFQGRLVSRSRVYNSLYFASFRVLRPLKGHLPPQLRRQLKLMFRPETAASACPASFDVRSGVRYVVFATQTSAARFVAVARPVQWSRNVARAARRTLCRDCARSPSPSLRASSSLLRTGRSTKLVCATNAGNLATHVRFLVDNKVIVPNQRFRIRHKRRKSTLRLTHATKGDEGNYTCSAQNVLGNATSDAISIRVVDASASKSHSSQASPCPIADFCLNGGHCLFYDFLGELVCRCRSGFTGHRCEFKAAQVSLPPHSDLGGCGPYGHDAQLRAICAALRRPSPEAHMTINDFRRWSRTQTKAMLISNNN